MSIRGDMHRIRIGARSSIQDNSCLHITHASEFNPNGNPLIIGNDVTIGHMVMLHGCTIVPPGKKLVSGYLYLGSPVKQVRPLTEDELNYFHYACQNYVKLKNDYLKHDDN